MSDVFKLVRIFLASPGDLEVERRLIKDTEEELNNGIATHLGYRIEVRGWEDTLSGLGRPQAVINKDLDQCELFIGMMWRKWGTPPSEEGDFTSGFEEEYERSLTRYNKTGKPEMALYFKDIDPDFLKDPGEDLNKVIIFKKNIQSERTIYYETFKDPHDLQKRVRLKIQKYLFELENEEQDATEENQEKAKKSIEPRNITESEFDSLFSSEGHNFLSRFLKKTEKNNQTDVISSFEIARFRLLSGLISTSKNDELFLGVHDANIIYLNREKPLSRKEISELINCSLINLDHENTPLWFWLALYNENNEFETLALRSLLSGKISINSIKAMIYLGTNISHLFKDMGREFFIENWLSKESSDEKKIAALNYLKLNGTEEDIKKLYEEYNSQNSMTTKLAIEAIVSIQANSDKKSAIETIIKNQFDSFDRLLIDKTTSNFSLINIDLLRIGLTHKNDHIRLNCFKQIKKDLTHQEILNFKNDPFAQIRKEVVEHLSSSGQVIEEKEIRSILVQPKKVTGLAYYSSNSDVDEEGENCYKQYLHEKYSKLKETELINLVEKTNFSDESPYLALCDKYFSKHASQLRKDIDNKFEEKFSEYINYLKDIGIPQENINDTQKLGIYYRQIRTRKALNYLCRKNKPEDIERVRYFMRSDFIGSSADDLKYLEKWGEWSDIESIANAKQDTLTKNRSLLTFSEENKLWCKSVSDTLYAIGKNRLEKLFLMNIETPILVGLIQKSATERFSKISEETILILLNKKDANIRKAAALKCSQSFNKKKIKSILDKYSNSPDYKYYNAIFWLDLGVSMPKSLSNNSSNRILNEI